MIIPPVILYPLISPVWITYTSSYLITVSLVLYVENKSGWTTLKTDDFRCTTSYTTDVFGVNVLKTS